MKPILTNALSVATFVFSTFICLFLFTGIFKGCKGNAESYKPTRDTTVSITYIIHQGDTAIKPTPVQTIAPQTVPPQYVVIPLKGNETPPELISKYEALLEKYSTLLTKHIDTNKYNNTIVLRDSSGADVGNVELKQSVTENQLQPYTPKYSLKLPVVTNTMTENQPYIPRRQILIGILGGTTPQGHLISGSLMYKDKKNNYFQGKAGKIIGVKDPVYEVGYHRVFRLRR